MDAPLPVGLVPAWEKYLSGESRRKRGMKLYPEVFEDDILFPLQRQRETEKMISLAASRRPRVAYEIGSDKGGGVYHWVKCIPSVKRMIACEIRGVPYMHAFNAAFPDVDFLWLAESSYANGTVDYVRKWLGEDKIDILFIDGDKSAFDRDFEMHLPLMAKDGIVMMHDVVDPPMKNVFESVGSRFRTEHIRDVSEAYDAIQREIRGDPPGTAHEGWLRYWKERSCSVGVIYIGEPK